MRPPLRPPVDLDASDEAPAVALETQEAATDTTAQPAPAAAKPPTDLLDIVDPIPTVEPIDNPFGLSPMELLFVEAYVGVANFRAAKAYELAGYKTTGSACRANASRMLTRERVAAAIADKCHQRVNALRIMDGDEALEGISNMGRVDIRKVFPRNSEIAALPDDVADAIKSIRPTKYGYAIELYDKMHAREVMAKVAGRLKETVKVEHTLEDIMAAANQPADSEGAA